MILGDFGAEVIKVESPTRHGETFGTGSSPGREQRRTAVLNAVNRNKRSIAIDLKSDEGREIFRRLATTADVLVEGFRPGVLDRLGAGYGELAAINPRLIYCSMSGFGQDGPYRDVPGHDLNYLALAGVLGLIGARDRPPSIPLNLIADYGSASFGATIGILLALVARNRTGRGQRVDTSYLDGVIAMLGASPVFARFLCGARAVRRGEGVFGGEYPYYAVYETSDRAWLALACAEPHLWTKFCHTAGREAWIPFACRLEHFTEGPDEETRRVTNEVAALMKTRSREQWLTTLGAAGVCVAPVLSLDEVVDHPQVRARRMVIDVEDAEFGPIRQPGIAFKLSGTPGSVRTLAPCRGADTDTVLGELGYDREQIEAARTAGAIE